MNTALLRDIYRWYTETDKKEVKKELLAKIEKAREQYFERKDNSKQAYLEESKKKTKMEKLKRAPMKISSMKSWKKHIREKIKREFSEDIPNDHIVYDMSLEDDRVNIRVYQNQDKKIAI
ncbi:hypothetical protein C7H83_03310 [Tetragenococcus halophilus]|uniref:Uncharacterized protein n=1 Tax=Tetragenococcus halophilus TaxID=51669 RepID=A0A3G5FGW0_TETHA|nr:hypothetical protein [Tetragenococcus halophilus]AYW49583.1 hypothetical protein C7H83_03310 [Tetragenococcus halophilus]GBD63540.1 putative uncharacterized protein [Tetragenococcus halophilus subsp. flandriensis]